MEVCAALLLTNGRCQRIGEWGMVLLRIVGMREDPGPEECADPIAMRSVAIIPCS